MNTNLIILKNIKKVKPALVGWEIHRREATRMLEFITIKEAAALLHYSPNYIRKLVFLHQIPYIKPRGRILFDRERLITWARAGAVEPLAERADALVAEIGG